MVAFILPITWMLTGGISLGLLYRVASVLGLTGLAVDNWRLRKCVDLGIDPKTLGLAFESTDSARNRVAAELGIEVQDERKHVFDIEPSSVPHHPWLAMRYYLIGTEIENFLDGMRHLELLDGVGPEAERLRELIKGTNIEYEDLSFLWEGFGCDFAKLQKFSKKRLADVGLRKLVGLPITD